MAERSVAPITLDDLARLAELARTDRDQLFARHRLLGRRYAERVLCVALCQGAALHYVDGRSGVKDFDVWTFYAAHPDGPFPYRRVARADFGPSKFGRLPNDLRPYAGRRVDLIGRSLPVGLDTDPVQALRRCLATPGLAAHGALARKAVVLVDPAHLRGVVAWPVHPDPSS
jgi:hypothetical protein